MTKFEKVKKKENILGCAYVTFYGGQKLYYFNQIKCHKMD